MRSRILVGLLMGALGGVLGWLLQERLIDYNAIAQLGPAAVPGQLWRFPLAVGGMIGLCLGAVDGIVEGNSRKLARGLAVGGLGGVLLGVIGFAAGNSAYNALGGRDAGAGRISITSF